MAVTQSNGLNRGVSDPALGTDTRPGDHRDTDDIRRNIDRTRTEMDRTIDELSERLKPRNLFDDLVDSVRCSVFGSSTDSAGRQRLMSDQMTDAASRAGRTLLEAVRENPVPAALMGAGLAWLLFEDKAERAYRRNRILAHQRGYTGNRFTDPGTHSGSYVDARTGKPYDESYGAGYADLDRDGNPDVCPPSMMDKAKHAASGVGETLSGAAHAVGSAMHAVGDAAGKAVHGVKSLAETTGHMASKAGHGVRSASHAVGDYGRTAGSAVCETGSTVADYSRTAASSVADYGRTAASSVADFGHTTADSVREFGHTAADSMRSYGRKAGQGISTGVDFSKERFDRALNEKPLAVGVAAMAAGVLVGFALPRTRTEDEMCGDVSDRFKDRVRHRGEELLDQGKGVASHLADAALGEAEGAGLTPENLGGKIAKVAKDALHAAQESAEREGIAPGAIADKAMQVASAVKEKGKEELKDVAPASLTGESCETSSQGVQGASASLGPSDLGSAGGGDMSAVTEGPETKHDIAEGMSASSEKTGTTAGALSDDTTKGDACNC